MVTKKKKSNRKSKKIIQKVDLNEPQEVTNNKSTINESESKEIITDESDVIEGLVHCKYCKDNVEPYPDGKNWRCPECNKYVQSPVMKKGVENLKEVKASKDHEHQIISSRNIKFNGSELAEAEMLLNAGVAKDFNDLAKKAFNVLFLKEKLNEAFGKDKNKMETNNEPNPERTMKQIQEQEMMKAYIEGMRKGNQTDPMATMMMMRMMENQGKGKDSGSNGFMDKILEMKMMQMMMGENNSETANLKNQLAELKHDMQMQQILSQQQQQQQGSQSSQEFMKQMEAIRAERDQAIKKAEVDAQKERDRNLELAFENRKSELENRLKNLENEKQKNSGTLSTQRIKDMKDEIAAIKEMSSVLGNKEKGTGEMLLENLGPVAEKVIPALMEMGQRKQQQQFYQPQQLPPELQPQPIQETSSEMTPSEQQMSDSNRYVEY